MQHLTNRSSTWVRDLLLLALGILVIYSIFLTHSPLNVPDEARYAEIPREMVELGDYITPHLNYIKYFEKPAFFYWLQAGAIKSFGLDNWVIRLPNLIMALLGCLLTYGLGRVFYDRRTGLFAAVLLASSALYFFLGHVVTIDMTLSTLLTASLFCFMAGMKAPPNTLKQSLFYYGFYSCTALAVLTKGLIGIIFPGIIIGLWIILLNQWKILKTIHLPTGILLWLMVAVPWHALVQWHNPEFFQFYFLEQQFLRYFSDVSTHYQPLWFFIPVLAAGFLPWSAFLPQALRYSWPHPWKNRQQDPYTFFLLLWAILIFAFFSLSQSKLIPYIIPLFPPLAVLVGRYLATPWKKGEITLGIQRGYAVFLSLIFISNLFMLVALRYHFFPELSAIKMELLTIELVWLSGAAGSVWLIKKRRPLQAFINLIGIMGIGYAIILFTIPKLDARPIYPLAQIIKKTIRPGDQVVSYENYYHDLPFYLQRRITVVDSRSELAFGMQHQDTTEWMINTPTFLQLWKKGPRIFMVATIEDYVALKKSAKCQPLYLLGQTRKDVLVTNQL